MDETIRAYDERAILQAVAAGDEHAFRLLFDRFRPKLQQYLSHFIRSSAIAEELVMDVFLKLWLGRDLLPEVVNLDAFLLRVARNKAIDFLRSAARDPRLSSALWDQIQQTAAASADEVLAQKELDRLIREALRQLPAKTQAVYALSREQGLSHDQIADRMGLASSTVNNHISDARKWIRTYLSRHLDLAVVLLAAGKL